MAGPIFISHSVDSKNDVTALASALRETFRGSLRTFNSSGDTAIPLGTNWRDRILDALKDAALVILWATDAALQSPEVAFEIGASCAYERTVIPCCIHIPPNTLPWSLAERQALVMDSETGWDRLADRIAEVVGFGGSLDHTPLRTLARRFEAPSHALTIIALGYTLELKNVSSSPVFDVKVESSDPTQPEPEWREALEPAILPTDKSVILFRDATESPSEILLTWTDVADMRQRRVLTIPATKIDPQ